MCSLASSFSSFSDSSTSSSNKDLWGDRFVASRVTSSDMCNNYDTKSEIFLNAAYSQYYSDKLDGGADSNQENVSSNIPVKN